MSGLIINPYAFGVGGGDGGDFTYFRILISEGNDANYVGIEQIQIFDADDDNPVLVDGQTNVFEDGVTASASSTEGGFAPADGWKLIRDWQCGVGQVTDSWLQIQLPSAVAITRYSVKPYTTGRSPRSWKLQGSNDGADWTDLDEQSSVTWSSTAAKEYTLS
jgi:hypothetical protein